MKVEAKTNYRNLTTAVLLFGLLAVAAFLFGFKQITDADTLWHLASGKLIAEQGPPNEDPFSFRTAGREWIDAQWLFQLCIFMVYRLAGFAGLSVLTGVIIALTWLLLCYATWDQRAAPVTWVLFLLALWAASDRLNLRPEIFSFFLIAAYLHILERDRAKPGRLLFILVPCQMLWANIEGIWPVGLIIIGAYWAEAMIVRYFSKTWLDKSASNASGRLLVLLALSTVACFANPYHYHGFLFPLTLLAEVSGPSSYFKETIVEFRHPFAEGDSIFIRVPFLILTALSALSFGLDRRKLRPAHLLLWTAFLSLAWSATRNIGLFSIAAALFASFHFRSIFNQPSRLSGATSWRIIRTFSLAAGLGLTLFYFIAIPANKFYIWDRSFRIFGAGFDADYDLTKAVDFLKQAGWKGKIFCDEVSAGYLIWTGYPDWKVYVDGRLELYGPELIKPAFESTFDYFLFSLEDKRWGFDAAIFARARTIDPASLTLVNKLYADPAWALVYLDEGAALYIKDTPGQHNIVLLNKIDLNANKRSP